MQLMCESMQITLFRGFI